MDLHHIVINASNQWSIRDSADGEGQPQRWGANLIFWQLYFETCMKAKKMERGGGGDPCSWDCYANNLQWSLFVQQNGDTIKRYIMFSIH